MSSGTSVPSVTDPTSPASSFGKADRPAIEILGYGFTVRNASCDIIWPIARPSVVAYATGLALWSLAGSDDLGWMSYYNPIAPQYSDDGTRLCGAFGKRLFDYEGSVDQIATVAGRLQADVASRRATAMVLSPLDNAGRAGREFPCAIAVQYFVRESQLCCVTHMRAQQAFTVLPIDAFLFLSLQHHLAALLGVGVGPYIHFSGTYHVYEAEREAITAFTVSPPPVLRFGPMFDAVKNVRALLDLERRVRTAARAGDENALLVIAGDQVFSDQSYYDDCARVLVTFGLCVVGSLDAAKAYASRARPSFGDALMALTNGKKQSGR
jgi:hypothetical protein